MLVKILNRLIAGMLIGIFCHAGYALDSDSEQPATINADEVEIDLNDGFRIYRGNVDFVQGSIKLTCDELTTYLNPNDELDKGICIGSPGIFTQRPQGSEVDFVGSALEITLDEIENLVTLKSQANVVQGGTSITGPIITYNKLTAKVLVKSTGDQAQQTGTPNTRASLTIQPRKKKTNE